MAVAPSPIDLTTVAAVKSWLGQGGATGSDDAIQPLITNVSRFIMSYLSRTILPATFSERYDGVGWGQARIMLNQWPVISLSMVSVGNSAIGAAPIPGPGSTYGTGYLLSPGQDYPPGAQQWLDFQGMSLPVGRQNLGVAYRAGYQMSESWVIPGSPWTVTPNMPWGQWKTDEGVTIAGVAAVRVASAPTAGQYSISFTGGVPTYLFAAADAGKTAVLSYGYIPGDLAQAAIEMIALRFQSKQFIGLVSKSLGGQESVTWSQRDMSETIRTMLQNYKRVF